MFDIKMFNDLDKEERLKTMIQMLEGLVSGDDEDITKLCNASALINALLGRVNWCGFYLRKKDELILGPFQGMPACTNIAIGKGVCGTSAKEKKVLRIDNVHEFEGHIACDAASNSEIVIPIVHEDRILGVLDIDSDEFNRFTEVEEKYLVNAVDILIKFVKFDNILQNKEK